MSNPFYQHDIINIEELTLAQINLLLDTARQLKIRASTPQTLRNKLIASCFFEPSTRTRLSFEAAVIRLGGQVIGFADGLSTSASKKGESLADSIRIIAEYADLLVIRHPYAGAARLAAEISPKPIINAGDGANQHPTQALIDLFTLQECTANLKQLNLGLVGDLKYSRTIHSLLHLCILFKIRLFLVAPPGLQLDEQWTSLLKQHGVLFSQHTYLEEIIPKINVLYMTRLQQERFDEKTVTVTYNPYQLTPELLSKAKPELKILHPLPRRQELPASIDALPYAHYFQQAANGLWIRQALLSLMLNQEFLNEE